MDDFFKDKPKLPLALPVLSFGPKNIYNANHEIWKSRGYIPHFDAGEIVQFITIRLYDSVPQHLIDRWKQQLQLTEGESDPKTVIKLIRLISNYEDSGRGECFFKCPEISQLLVDALTFNDNLIYRLLGWTVMPNHVHFMMIPLGKDVMSKTIQRLKSYIAHQANQILNRKGKFWQREYHDRYIRSFEHFIYARNYILNNPKKIGYTEKYTSVIQID